MEGITADNELLLKCFAVKYDLRNVKFTPEELKILSEDKIDLSYAIYKMQENEEGLLKGNEEKVDFFGWMVFSTLARALAYED